jgi:hypothetical protein
MNMNVSKVLVVAVMLIAFVGQALAYSSMSCEMSHESHMNMSHDSMDHSSMDHSSMDHASMDHSSVDQNSQNQHEECCGSDCVCPDSACMSIIIVGSDPKTAYVARLSESVSFQPMNQTKSIPTSLYRPPIFA